MLARMTRSLQKKRALVTGGSRGIAGIVLRLARDGFVTGASLTVDGDFTA
jgi:NAD(P)-dependent dehydrogenase (short-subunit alcohol dehydrogenase family)